MNLSIDINIKLYTKKELYFIILLFIIEATGFTWEALASWLIARFLGGLYWMMKWWVSRWEMKYISSRVIYLQKKHQKKEAKSFKKNESNKAHNLTRTTFLPKKQALALTLKVLYVISGISWVMFMYHWLRLQNLYGYLYSTQIL